MVSYVFLCAGQLQQEIVDVPGTKLEPQSKKCWASGHAHCTPPPPPLPPPLVETCAFGTSLGNYPRSAPDHGPLSFFMCWSAKAGKSGCSGDKNLVTEKTYNTSVLGRMHITDPSPLCSVVKNRSLGKRICHKSYTAKSCQPITSHLSTIPHPPPSFINVVKLSWISYRFLLLKPNWSSASIQGAVSNK